MHIKTRCTSYPSNCHSFLYLSIIYKAGSGSRKQDTQPPIFSVLSDTNFLKGNLALYIKCLKACILFDLASLLLGMYF